MIVSMFHTIQKMYHSICTLYSDSTSTYGGSEWQLPPHGSVQGNGPSSLICAVASTNISLALKEKNYGGTFRTPITNILNIMAGFACVDDMD